MKKAMIYQYLSPPVSNFIHAVGWKIASLNEEPDVILVNNHRNPNETWCKYDKETGKIFNFETRADDYKLASQILIGLVTGKPLILLGRAFSVYHKVFLGGTLIQEEETEKEKECTPYAYTVAPSIKLPSNLCEFLPRATESYHYHDFGVYHSNGNAMAWAVDKTRAVIGISSPIASLTPSTAKHDNPLLVDMLEDLLLL